MTCIERRRILTGLASAAATLGMASLARPALAQGGRPITIVVPFAPGGTASDAFARMMAASMTETLGRNVLVDNRPGGNGIIACTLVSRAAPDGMTLLMGGTGQVSLNIMLRPNLTYSLDSFQSVAMLFDGMLTLTPAARLKVKSIDGLVEYSQKNGPLRYGTFGPGSVSELYGAMLTKRLGLQLLPVPYKSNNAAIIDLVGGNGDFSVATPISLIDFHRRGEVNILALTTEKRYPAFPDIPSIAELGYPDLQSSYWTALHAPKGTPMDVVQQISAAAIKAVQEPKFHELLTSNGQTMKAGGPEALDAQLQHDQVFWGKIIKENNIVLS